MKVKCNHGYFIFEETEVGQISDFSYITGKKIIARENYYTFEPLTRVDKYSLKAKPILNLPAIKTFEGEPWEVLEANGFVYDFRTDIIVPIASIVLTTTLNLVGNRYISQGLLLPGCFDQSGRKIKSFSGWYSRERGTWLYSEVEFV